MIHLASPLIGEEEIAAVTAVMRTGMLAQGAEVAAFEEEFATALDAGHAAAVGNGTVALVAALQAIGVTRGDEVIVPSFTFAATANAVALLGARPVFADIDADTFCLDPNAVAAAISNHTRAIVAVHLYGHMASMEPLKELAIHRGLRLIEDAAQAHGAKRNDLPVGALADLATYSFYPTKNMTTGEGGMVTARDPELINTIRLYRNHGMARRYHHDFVGTNGRMTDIAAAIGRVQLQKLPAWNKRRREIAEIYNDKLGDAVSTPFVADGTHHVYHQYTIRSTDRSRLITSLERHDIGYGIYYPIPCHRQPAFHDLDPDVDLPMTDTAAQQVLSLPIRPDLTDSEIGQVIDAVLEGTTS